MAAAPSRSLPWYEQPFTVWEIHDLNGSMYFDKSKDVPRLGLISADPKDENGNVEMLLTADGGRPVCMRVPADYNGQSYLPKGTRKEAFMENMNWRWLARPAPRLYQQSRLNAALRCLSDDKLFSLEYLLRIHCWDKLTTDVLHRIESICAPPADWWRSYYTIWIIKAKTPDGSERGRLLNRLNDEYPHGFYGIVQRKLPSIQRAGNVYFLKLNAYLPKIMPEWMPERCMALSLPVPTNVNGNGPNYDGASPITFDLKESFDLTELGLGSQGQAVARPVPKRLQDVALLHALSEMPSSYFQMDGNGICLKRRGITGNQIRPFLPLDLQGSGTPSAMSSLKTAAMDTFLKPQDATTADSGWCAVM